jgi:hypothetical protein
MAKAMADEKKAIRVAKQMESNDGEISINSALKGRYVFNFDGSVHAHKIEEGWKFSGFGTRWFAIRKE